MVDEILEYLERPPCNICSIDGDGLLHHCALCQPLYDAALAKAKTADPPQPLTYAEKKQMETDRFYEVGYMKKSHKWVGSQSFADNTRSRMVPYASHCQACGLSMILFKAKPAWCPKNPNPEGKK